MLCSVKPGALQTFAASGWKRRHMTKENGSQRRSKRKSLLVWWGSTVFFFIFQKVQLIPGPWYSHVMTYVTSWVVIIYALPETASCGTINEQPAPIRLPSRSGACGAISSGPVYPIPDIFHCHVSHQRLLLEGFMPTFPCVAETVSWDLCQGCDGPSDVYNPGCLRVSWLGSGK